MASSPKKTSTSRASAGGRRSSTQKSGGRGKKPSPQTHKPFRREVGAVVCLFLAVFSSFGYFQLDGIFIDFFCRLMKGLLGYGFWVTPPALLLAAYILAFHRGRPVRLRLTCALLLPVVFSALLHGLLAQPLPWDAALFKSLWASGEALQSGGILSGILAQACVSLFTSLGCTIVFAMAGILMGLAAFNRTLFDVADWIFNRPHYDYEYEEEPERPRRTLREERSSSVSSTFQSEERHPSIDIPLDDGPLAQSERKKTSPKKKGFFDRSPRVPAPDQLLTGKMRLQEENSHPKEEEEVFVTQPIDPPKPIAVVPPVTVAPPTQPAQRTVLETPTLQRETPPVNSHQKETEEEKAKPQEVAREAEQVTREIESNLEQEGNAYQYPPLSLLKEGPGDIGGEALAELNANRQRLAETIHSFGIEANILNVTRGPSVTRYELELDQGVRLNKLTNLSDDIALALGASGVRIAPIPDQISMVGIEVPNKLVSPVNIHSVIGSKVFTDSASKVSFAVGKDIGGNPIVGNIAKMPHLLIAGTTGSGKSVCTNSLIISLLYKATPEEVRLIMVDPKMVELGIYNGIPHLLIPVVTDPKKAAGALQWAVTEMMKRYRTFSEVGVRDLASYNAMAAKTEGMQKMPQVVVIIDELADLMLVAAKEVEESICRVAQMGRASGMHLIIATQRPSADVITGLMKANIPSRIAFAVASSLESRIILDITGAEKLVGRGDMLYFPLGAGKPTRVQGCLITDQEVASVVEFVKKSGAVQYDDTVMQEIEQHVAEKEKGNKGVGGSIPEDANGDYDELIDAAAEVVVETGQASVSMLQRRLKLGYARAARLVDQLEEKGIVGPFEGSKPRQLLITKEQWQEMKYRNGIVSQAPNPVGEMSISNSGENVPPFDVEDALDRAGEDTL
ncbi:MAG: DNA translocase FtsK [Lawsonibacter sp.]|jgi:S-DNA-T family DNA segregation ATPase FtsK/SpoIIIE